MIDIDLDKWKMVLFNVNHYPNDSMIKGELLFITDFNLYRKEFNIIFSSDLKKIIKPIGKLHSSILLKHIEKRIYKNRIHIVCGDWDEIK
jgi:hypothetical protein